MTEQSPPEEERLLEAALAQLPEGLLEQAANSRRTSLRQSSTGTVGRPTSTPKPRAADGVLFAAITDEGAGSTF